MEENKQNYDWIQILLYIVAAYFIITGLISEACGWIQLLS